MKRPKLNTQFIKSSIKYIYALGYKHIFCCDLVHTSHVRSRFYINDIPSTVGLNINDTLVFYIIFNGAIAELNKSARLELS